MAKRKELSGMRFGKLIVVNVVGVKLNCGYEWRCLCDCGNIKIVLSKNLINGGTQSCGCLYYSKTTQSALKAGTTNTIYYKDKGYTSWKQMKLRCLDETDKRYKNYGGRGITICDEWKDSFIAFITDIGERPSKKHSIERIDNNKGYCKENCRWATAREQAENRRTSKKVVYNSIEYPTITALARFLDIRTVLLWRRINKNVPEEKWGYKTKRCKAFKEFYQ